MLPHRADRSPPSLHFDSRPAARPAARPVHLTLVLPRYGEGPPVGPPPEAALPDWLDLLLCIVAPSLVALLVIGSFNLVLYMSAAL